MEAIGYKFTNNVSVLNKQLNEAGLCFMHAPLFHPAMKNVAPVRKELGVRTFFNLLGPLVNPCNPKYMVLGTYNLEIMRLYNYLLQESHHRYSIVHSFDGYDEISLTGNYKVVSVDREQIMEPTIKLKAEDLSGGKTVAESAKIFMKVLEGNGSNAQNEVVIANAAMAINCVKENLSLQECNSMARESLRSKQSLNVYKKLISFV